MKVRDPFVRIDHVQVGLAVHAGLKIGLDDLPSVGGQFRDLGIQIAKAVVGVHAQFGKGVGMLFEHVGEKHADCMAEQHWVGDFHHRGLQVQGEQDPLRFGSLNLRLVKGAQRLDTHERCINDFAID